MALRTVYCVQTYGMKGAALRKGQLRQFGSSHEALEKAAELRDRVAGVLVFSVRGEPAFDYWEDPQVLASHGEVPSLGPGQE